MLADSVHVVSPQVGGWAVNGLKSGIRFRQRPIYDHEIGLQAPDDLMGIEFRPVRSR